MWINKHKSLFLSSKSDSSFTSMKMLTHIVVHFTFGVCMSLIREWLRSQIPKKKSLCTLGVCKSTRYAEPGTLFSNLVLSRLMIMNFYMSQRCFSLIPSSCLTLSSMEYGCRVSLILVLHSSEASRIWEE